MQGMKMYFCVNKSRDVHLSMFFTEYSLNIIRMSLSYYLYIEELKAVILF